jgi:hypothetical protein
VKAALLTASYGGYDPLKPVPPQDVECEYICVTDDGALDAGWQIVYEPRPGVHPNLAAKRPKMCPWDYTDADVAIWIDASMVIYSSFLISEVFAYLPFGQYDHPDRDCIYDEGTYSMGLRKYADLPLEEQMDDYKAQGHPEHWGLWAGGLIIRQRTPEIEAFGRAWLAECEKWSFQDQVSEAVMLRKFGLRPVSIPGAMYQSQWFRYEGSTRH